MFLIFLVQALFYGALAFGSRILSVAIADNLANDWSNVVEIVGWIGVVIFGFFALFCLVVGLFATSD